MRRSWIAGQIAGILRRLPGTTAGARGTLSRLLIGPLVAACLGAPLPLAQPVAAQTTIGPETRLPLPRYVSLKTDKVNMREGPSKDHSTRWVFQHAGLPVEIIAEFDNWRRIRDPEGADGWVWHTLLSGRRTAIVTPWDRGIGDPISVFERPDPASRVVARLEPGVIANISSCVHDWCRLTFRLDGRRDTGGFIAQEKLWGVYPDETLN